MALEHPLLHVEFLLFDADGTLRTCYDENLPCPNVPEDWKLLPRVGETLRLYGDLPMAVVSNQGGVALGFLDEAVAYSMLWDTIQEARGSMLHTEVYMCAHSPRAACPCRKPSPFYLLTALHDLWLEGRPVSLERCLYVGDMASDQEAAKRAEMPFMPAHEFFGWEPPHE